MAWIVPVLSSPIRLVCCLTKGMRRDVGPAYFDQVQSRAIIYIKTNGGINLSKKLSDPALILVILVDVILIIGLC